MESRFDKNDVLRFLYDEMAPAEQDKFLTALTEDEELWEEYEAMQSATQLVDQAVLEPSTESIEKIKAAIPAITVDLVLPTVDAKPAAAGISHSIRQAVSALMLFVAVGSVALLMFGWQETESQTIFSEDNSRLQWEAPQIENRIDHLRMNLRNLSEGESIAPVSGNTYQVVNTGHFAPNQNNVVLVNLR